MSVILIVDDECIIGNLLAEVLADEGHEVVVAHDGFEGIRRIEHSCPDIVICDYMMPGLDGAALLKTLRAHPKCKDVPFILMSALAPSGTPRTAIEYSAFIKKPFRLDEIVRLVSKFLSPGA